ncbi:twin-arginine translocation signal domain-containing protein [Candidatus Woesearchaeota archaeon]|nr:twin-arginine translocation signal domain-containing protein [Candidatus Woesearchaeota archaeon]
MTNKKFTRREFIKLSALTAAAAALAGCCPAPGTEPEYIQRALGVSQYVFPSSAENLDNSELEKLIIENNEVLKDLGAMLEKDDDSGTYISVSSWPEETRAKIEYHQYQLLVLYTELARRYALANTSLADVNIQSETVQARTLMQTDGGFAEQVGLHLFGILEEDYKKEYVGAYENVSGKKYTMPDEAHPWKKINIRNFSDALLVLLDQWNVLGLIEKHGPEELHTSYARECFSNAQRLAGLYLKLKLGKQEEGKWVFVEKINDVLAQGTFPDLYSLEISDDEDIMYAYNYWLYSMRMQIDLTPVRYEISNILVNHFENNIVKAAGSIEFNSKEEVRGYLTRVFSIGNLDPDFRTRIVELPMLRPNLMEEEVRENGLSSDQVESIYDYSIDKAMEELLTVKERSRNSRGDYITVQYSWPSATDVYQEETGSITVSKDTVIVEAKFTEFELDGKKIIVPGVFTRTCDLNGCIHKFTFLEKPPELIEGADFVFASSPSNTNSSFVSYMDPGSVENWIWWYGEKKPDGTYGQDRNIQMQEAFRFTKYRLTAEEYTRYLVYGSNRFRDTFAKAAINGKLTEEDPFEHVIIRSGKRVPVYDGIPDFDDQGEITNGVNQVETLLGGEIIPIYDTLTDWSEGKKYILIQRADNSYCYIPISDEDMFFEQQMNHSEFFRRKHPLLFGWMSYMTLPRLNVDKLAAGKGAETASGTIRKALYDHGIGPESAKALVEGVLFSWESIFYSIRNTIGPRPVLRPYEAAANYANSMGVNYDPLGTNPLYFVPSELTLPLETLHEMYGKNIPEFLYWWGALLGR